MKIAVIGGGAAGLVTAWLLDGVHEVVLLERASSLGGNIRTLNRNVPTSATELFLDAGVIEFESRRCPRVMRLLDTLGVPVIQVQGATTFAPEQGPRLLSPRALRHLPPGPRRAAAWAHLLPLRAQLRSFMRRTELSAERLRHLRLDELLVDDELSCWFSLLVMYAYSIPRPRVGAVPAALAVPMLRRFYDARSWVSVVGGVYRYVEALLGEFGGQIHTDAQVRALHREPGGVRVQLARGELQADAVVLATPPDQVLEVLAKPTPQERRRFGSWAANHVTTTVHRDEGVYARRGFEVRTEFDVFQLPHGEGAYNACLDRLCRVPSGRSYGLAFGLDEELDEGTIIERVPHHTPDYTVPALTWREEVLTHNGEHRTWFAGAWLDDGLHEGALASASRVSEALGGAGL